MLKKHIIPVGIGLVTGSVTGIFGGGGGMILVPLLSLLPGMKEDSIFPSSIAVILPVCIISIFLSKSPEPLSLARLAPYLLGSLLGGLCAGIWGRKIPVGWLHRLLGILILWGGIRYLWQTAS